MKKVLALMLAAVLCFSLCACTGGQSEKEKEEELEQMREVRDAYLDVSDSLNELQGLIDQYKGSN